MLGMDKKFPPESQPAPELSETAGELTISSATDERIADYCDVRERDLTGREGKFMIESMFVLDTALRQNRYEIDSILITAGKAEKLKHHIALAKARGSKVYLASQDVMDAIAGFHIHRGVLAIGKRPIKLPLDAGLAGLASETTVLLGVGLSNHDNVGALFRNAAAFGVGMVLLDEDSCDPLYRKAIRVSAGHVLTTPFHHGDTADEIINALEAHGFTLIAMTPGADRDIRQQKPRERVALVLGAEGPGLPPHILARLPCARIPMAPGVDSLNVATAAAVALSHITHI